MMKEKYNKEVIPVLVEKFEYKNKNQAPKIEKVVVNVGFGREAIARGGDDLKKFISGVLDDLALITGQKPSLRTAKKSIAGFKLRAGVPIGAKVTLRGDRMYDFLDRLVNIALPRSRDFRGLDIKHFDEDGNLSLGVKEHIIFPEVSAEKMKNIFGFEVTVNIKANSKEEGIELLRLLGFPIKK